MKTFTFSLKIFGLFFLVIFPTSGFAQSAGLTWTDRSPGIAAIWHGVGSGTDPINGTPDFIVVGTNMSNTEVATSPDGETWTRRPTGIGGIFHDVEFEGDYVAVGTNTSAAIVGTSPDGITWTSRNSGVGGILHAVTHSPWRGFVAVGSTGAGAIVVDSNDAGVTWTSEQVGGVGPLYGVHATVTRTVAVGAAGTIIESDQALDFVTIPAITANDLHDVTYHAAATPSGWVVGWVAVGTNGAVLFKDINTATWQVIPSVTADHLYSVESRDGLLVATGSNGRILTSTDVMNWTVDPPTSITGQPLNGLIVAQGDLGSRWVTAGGGGEIFSAPTNGTSVGGQGVLDVEYSGPNSFGASGQTNLGFTVEAVGENIQTFVEASNWIRLINPVPQTINDGDIAGYAFEVVGNAYEASRNGVITISGGSSPVTLSFSQVGAPPLPPRLNVGNSLEATGEVPLGWIRGPGTTRGFRLEAERPLGSDNWVVLGTGDTSFSEYRDTGLPPWSIQHYRVFAYNNNGDSESENVHVRTRPIVPPDFAASPDGWSRARLTWSDVPQVDQYTIQRQIEGEATWSTITTLDPGRNQFIDIGLPADTLVRYRMITRGGGLNPPGVFPITRYPFSQRVEITVQTPPYTGQIYWGNAVEENLTPPVQDHLTTVAYGGGKYIAVGANGTILGSPDGSTWILEPEPAGGNYVGVTYGAGIWLAVGTTDSLSGPILRSTGDGTWTLHTIPGVRSTSRVAFQNGVFLVMALRDELNPLWNRKGRLYTSTDGVNWTAGRDLEDAGEISVGNGQFIVCTALDGTLVSTDGVTWTSVTNGLDRSRYAFGGAGAGRWFGAGLDSSFNPVASRSPDGLTWADGATGLGAVFNFWLVAEGGMFVTGIGDSVATSTDSVTWSQVQVLPNVPFYGGTPGPQGWVTVGDGVSSPARPI